MRLYCKHHFIYQKLTGSHIRTFVFFIVILEFFLIFVLVIVKKLYGKKALSVNHSSGHFIKLNAI